MNSLENKLFKNENKLIFFIFYIAYRKTSFIFAPRKQNGLVVQLVRIHACHAWGREFESRPDRKKLVEIQAFFYA